MNISPAITSAFTALTTLQTSASQLGASASVLTVQDGEQDSYGKRTHTDRLEGARADQSEYAAIKKQEFSERLAYAHELQNPKNAAPRRKHSEFHINQLRSRANEMLKALEKLQSISPIPRNADILVVAYHNGNANVSAMTSGAFSVNTGSGNDALAISAETVSDVHTGDGADALAIEANIVRSIHSGGGNDALAILANVVQGIGTSVETHGSQSNTVEQDNDAVSIVANSVDSVYTGAGHDAVSINARFVSSIYTGKDADSISIQANVVSSVYAGAGNDNIAIEGDVVSNIVGGYGDDTISVDAVIGQGVSTMRGDMEYVRGSTVEARLAMAAKGYRYDSTNQIGVSGGAGDDTIAIRVQEIMNVSGGAGDDKISVSGGTVALFYSSGDGSDTVTLSNQAEVVIQLGKNVDKSYTVEQSDDTLTLHFVNGETMQFDGLKDAAAIGISRAGGLVTMLYTNPQQSQEPLDVVI